MFCSISAKNQKINELLLYTKNQELLDILADNGISMVCNDNMDIVISEDDAMRIESIVSELAPFASGDYAIED